MKPEEKYEFSNLTSLKGIRPFETYVIGRAYRFDVQRREIKVDLGNGFTGIIPEEEASVYEFTYPNLGSVPLQISTIIGSKVKAIVMKKLDDKSLLLSRKISMENAWNNLQEGTEVDSVVTAFHGCGIGIFIDVGDGLTSYISKKEYSVTRIKDFRNWEKVGNFVKVMILDKGHGPKSRIAASRRLLYPTMADVESEINPNDVISVRSNGTIADDQADGYFCEYKPGIPGIIDTKNGRELYEGERVTGYVKGITPFGLKIKEIG